MSTLDAVGFVANFAAMVIGSAVLLLTLWQSRRLTNLVLGVFLSAVIINSAALMLVRVTQLLALDLMLISKTVAAASGTYGILFFAFGMVFIRDTPRWAVPAVLGSAVLWGVGQWFIWTDRFLRTVTLLPSGRSPIGFTPIGFVLITLLLSYLGLTMVMIIRSKDDRARTLIVPLSLLILATLSNVIPPFSELPVFGILVALSVVTLGRVIIHDRMMNPIIELNDQLEQANAELERANMLKTQFMATMSHELRTPLNAIIGFSQMLAEGTYGELNERQSERLHVVLSNADHLLQLINDVLDLSKIEAGRIILQFEPVDPIRVIQDVLVQFRQDAARKNLYLTLDTAPDLPEVVVDETRLRQIMFNLMSNAVKFTKKGGIIVEVRLDDRRQQILISVTDTGVGIPDDLLNEIFEAFRQVDGSMTREFSGTGLGLAITQRLARLHGGDVTVKSRVGHGSTFTVRLPLTAEQQP